MPGRRARQEPPLDERAWQEPPWRGSSGQGDADATRVLPAKPGPPAGDDPGQGRGALWLAGVLGAALVLAIGLVAVSAMRKPSGKDTANVTLPTTQSTSAPPSVASSSPSPSHSASKNQASQESPLDLSVPAGWKLTFDPSFAGNSLDTSTWTTCYDWATSLKAGCTNNRSIEREWYLPSQVTVSGGTLNLTAKQEATEGMTPGGAPEYYNCRSGMVTSKPGFSFTYGLISVTAKIPYGAGLWPALWLAASNGQWPPELDIVEHWYYQSQAKIYDHLSSTNYVGGAVPTPRNLSTSFNTFSLLWTKDRVTWYLDGAKVYTTTTDVPQQAMYFLANVADDSTAAGACNGTLQISSIKVWQP